MADVKDMLSAHSEAESALQRAYGANDNHHTRNEAIAFGLVALGRCVLAVGMRLEVAIRESSKERI